VSVWKLDATRSVPATEELAVGVPFDTGCAFTRTVVPPIKPAIAAAKASDFVVLFME